MDEIKRLMSIGEKLKEIKNEKKNLEEFLSSLFEKMPEEMEDLFDGWLNEDSLNAVLYFVKVKGLSEELKNFINMLDEVSNV